MVPEGQKESTVVSPQDVIREDIIPVREDHVAYVREEGVTALARGHYYRSRGTAALRGE